jgi:hypothetical protein
LIEAASLPGILGAAFLKLAKHMSSPDWIMLHDFYLNGIAVLLLFVKINLYV